MEQLEMLWLYQQEDMKADRLENDIKRSPTRVKLIKSRDFLVEQQNAIKRIEEDVATMTDRMDAIKDAMARTAEQLNALQAKVEATAPENLEDAKQLAGEAKRLLGNISDYEQEMKRIRKDAQDRDRQQHEIRTKAARVKADFDKLKVAYDTEYKEKMKELEAQRQIAAEKAKGISPELMEKYKAIKLHIVPPIARLLGDQCGGCNMSLPSVVLRTIKAGTTIVECETCGRMIIQ